MAKYDPTAPHRTANHPYAANVQITHSYDRDVCGDDAPGIPSRFEQLLDDLRETHRRKSRDYGTDSDRLANINASTRLGVAPAHATVIRMCDKFSRVEQLIKRRYSTGAGPAVAGETLVDTLRDLAVYSLLCIELLEQEKSGP